MKKEIKVIIDVNSKDNSLCSKYCRFFCEAYESNYDDVMCFLYDDQLFKNGKVWFERCEECLVNAK